MKRTELINPQNEFEIYRIWNNLLNSLLSLALVQYISITSILYELLTKLKSLRFQSIISRDWLMWYLLQIISSNKKQKVKILKF